MFIHLFICVCVSHPQNTIFYAADNQKLVQGKLETNQCLILKFLYLEISYIVCLEILVMFLL